MHLCVCGMKQKYKEVYKSILNHVCSFGWEKFTAEDAGEQVQFWTGVQGAYPRSARSAFLRKRRRDCACAVFYGPTWAMRSLPFPAASAKNMALAFFFTNR